MNKYLQTVKREIQKEKQISCWESNKNSFLQPLLLFIFLFASHLSFAQIYNMDGSNIDDCSGFFYDSGGSSGSYSSSESFTTTICSDGIDGTHIQLIFSAVDLVGGDLLCFFDGTDATAPAIACNTDFVAGNPFIIQASAANVSGCVTITFNSDGTGEAAGWQADINCIPACQTILAELVSSDPIVSPVDTGYIDICQGERVFFNGAGMYPQNNVVYPHSDLTSSFEWDFGDGSFGLGPNVSHVYEEEGGYIVQLTITDQFGCENTNFLSQRVRVSTSPSFSILEDIPQEICAGDTINLNAVVSNVDSAFVVGVVPNSGSFPNSGVNSDTISLPDGVGVAYENTISFGNFSPGQVLTNINDLVSVCVVMEHSWMRDLEIALICPDGTEVILHDHPFNMGGEVFLGEPNTTDENLPLPIPGVGYEYCWTVDATTGTWLEFANNNLPGFGATLPAGDYNSFDPLDDFFGCPLNGDWTIRIEDLWGSDNGFVFEWSIEFDASLYPDLETFTPAIIDYQWANNPSIFFQTNDSIAATPQNAGTASYSFIVNDEFGCTYDTTVLITVLPPTHPDCFSCPEPEQLLQDTTICDGEQVQINAENTTSLSNEPITFESFPTYTFGFSNHPPNNPYASPLEITTINPATINNAQQQICGVCVDLETDFDGDIRIHLRSPSGQVLELSTNNGGAGDNYTNTCFTPTASNLINTGSAPFTGDFLPEGDWADLNGSTINGTWELLVSDGFGVNGFGVVNSWSICFNNENNIEYQWGPVAGLSCYNCPDPVVDPSSSSVFTLDVSDDFGCDYSDTIAVNVVPQIAAPSNVSCDTVFDGTMSFVWESVPGFTSYLVNVNGTGWVSSSDFNSHLITGLSNGDLVSFEVQADAGNSNCNIGIATVTCTYFVCDVELEVPPGGIIAPSCYNEADGTIFVQAMGTGTGPFSYQLDNNPPQNTGIFNSTTSGDHQIILTDVDGCADTIIVNVPPGDSIGVSVAIDSVDCNGNSTGSATAMGTNGAGPFNYTWNTSPVLTFTPSINDVPAGEYIVTVTDGGCTVVDTIMIEEPDLLEVMTTPMAVSCFGDNDGSVSTTVTGGVTPYNYLWNDGQDTPIATGLVAGTYTVVVTDANGCFMESTEIVQEPTGMNFAVISIDVGCFGENTGSIDLEVNGGSMPYNYLWEDNSTNQDRNNLIANTYCVTVTDANLCAKDTCIIIIQPDSIMLDITSTSTTCLGNNMDGTGTVTPSGGVGSNYTFLWDDGQTNSTAVGLSPGIHCVVVMDGNGCQANACVEVTSPPLITIDSIVATNVLCNGEDTGFAEVFTSGGSGSFTYLWSDELAQFSNPANSLVTGTYTVTVTDAAFCTATATVFVDEPTVLTATIMPTDVNCFGGNNGTATANPVGGVGPYDFSWTTLPGQSSQFVDNLTAGTYTVTVTDANGCEIIQQTDILEPATEITAIVTQTKEGCFGANDGQAEVVASGGTGTNYTYLWSNPSGTATPSALNLSGGITYFVTVTDEKGCETVENITITDIPAIEGIGVITIDPTCNGDADGQLGVNIVSGGVGGGDLDNYTYAWSNGSTAQLNSNLEAGVYTLTVTDAEGCIGEEEISLDDPLPVSATADIQDASCFGLGDGQIDLTASSGNVPIASFTWDANANNQITATAIDLAAGNYLVTITDENDCFVITNFEVGQPALIETSFEVTDNPCFNDSEATISTTVTGGIPDFSYSWSSADTTNIFSSTDQNLSELLANQYTVTITDGNGCIKIDSVNVNSPAPVFAVLETDSVTCFGDENGLIFINALGGEGPFTYSLDGEEFTSSNTFLGLAEGGYTAYIRDRNGCDATAATTVFGPEEINVDLGDNITILLGEQATMTANVSPPGNYFYNWSPEDSLSCFDCPTTTAIGLNFQTSYRVSVEDEFGCKAEDFISIFVKKFRRVYVPTGFSPNGDSNNDRLRTHGDEGTMVTSFRVYDRWGEMVYENNEAFGINDPDIGWDGTFDGKEMNPGVFVWYLEVEYIDGARDSYKGQTTLIK